MLDGLNPEQRAAVLAAEGPLLVLAGAGSGKTGVITRKIAWLMRERGFTGDDIVAVTFTNKAAREMRERIAGLLGEKLPKSLQVSTFHRLGMEMLNRDGARLGLRPGFSIFDRDDAISVVGNLSAGLGALERQKRSQLVDAISWWKNLGLAPDEVDEEARARIDNRWAAMEASAIYADYERYLTACNAVDLDGLILNPLLLMRNFEAVRERWHGKLRYLLVDEYQDTNLAQFKLVRALIGPRCSFTMVGDDDQSIYAWRGADVDNLKRLGDAFSGLQVVKLTRNYRSTGRILALANRLIANNPRDFEKTLTSSLGPGDKPKLHVMETDEDEAAFVAGDIHRQHLVKQRPWSDFAVLMRSNRQARAIELKLRELGIPYRFTGGQSFFDRVEVRDLLAYLKLIANADDAGAFLRVVNTPRRGIGAATLERLSWLARRYAVTLPAAVYKVDADPEINASQRTRIAGFVDGVEELRRYAQTATASEVAKRLIDWCDYRAWLLESAQTVEKGHARLTRLDDAIAWIERLDRGTRGIEDVVRDLMLLEMAEQEDDDKEGKVQLMTVHAAKGLEFSSVYLVGLEEGLMPHKNSIEAGTVEEERRLLYVAITRARHQLSMSLVRRRQLGRQWIDAQPSRFVEELQGDELDLGNENRPADRETRKESLAAMRALLGD